MMKQWLMGAMVLAVSACGATLPQPEDVKVSAPSGMNLPVKGRAMVMLAEADLNRTFSYSLNRIGSEQTQIPEGKAMDRALHGVMGRAFSSVTTNDPALRPHVIARASGKAIWNRIDGTYRVHCEIMAYEGDGIPIGRFANAFSAKPLDTFESALAPLYTQCFKQPVEEMMASPALARMSAAGFPEPNQAASTAYLQAQGFAVR